MNEYFFSLEMICMMAADQANKDGRYSHANDILIAAYNIEKGPNR